MKSLLTTFALLFSAFFVNAQTKVLSSTGKVSPVLVPSDTTRFLRITGDQTATGTKTFDKLYVNSEFKVGPVRMGLINGTTTNLGLGSTNTLSSVTTGTYNLAVGMFSLSNLVTALAEALEAKASTASVTALSTALDGKASTAALAAKADTSALAGKASTASVTALSTALDGKASTASVTALSTALDGKASTADLATVAEALEAKADTSALAGKASTASVTALSEALEAKASTASVTALSTALDGKASTAALAAKADTSALAGKASTASVTALAEALDGKANVTNTLVLNSDDATTNLTSSNDLVFVKAVGNTLYLPSAASNVGKKITAYVFLGPNTFKVASGEPGIVLPDNIYNLDGFINVNESDPGIVHNVSGSGVHYMGGTVTAAGGLTVTAGTSPGEFPIFRHVIFVSDGSVWYLSYLNFQ